MTRYAATALILLSSATLSADTYVRQPGVSIAHYTFDITVGDTNDEIVMKETVDVRFVAAGVASLDLDLCHFAAHARQPPRPVRGADRWRARRSAPHAERWQGDVSHRGHDRRSARLLHARARPGAYHAAACVQTRRSLR